jgi:hypothetical protein
MEVLHFECTGENGGKLAVTFSEAGHRAHARIVIANDWKSARIVELDRAELSLLRDVLFTDKAVARKSGAYLKIEEGDLAFTARFTNRGEPYRDGFDFNLEKDWEGYPVFVESGEVREFAKTIDQILKQGA